MNNLLSYCGLVDARIKASEKDLPVRSFDLESADPNQTKHFSYGGKKPFGSP